MINYHQRNLNLLPLLKGSKFDDVFRMELLKNWNLARNIKLGPGEKKKHLDQLFELIQGKIPEILFKHDTSRIIQTCLKYGSKEQRAVIAKELEGRFVEASNPEFKDKIVLEFKGSVTKLIQHRFAHDVILELYECLNAKQRNSLIHEFYGPEFNLFKEAENKSMSELINEDPSNKIKILKNLSSTIEKMLKKPGLIGHIISHRILLDYFTCADDTNDNQVQEKIQIIGKHIPEILHTQKGSRVAMYCLAHGTVKQRKIMLQAMKEYVGKIACEEYGYLVLLRAFDKIIKSDDIFKQIMENKWGHRVILYLLVGRSKIYFSHETLKLLGEGDEIRKITRGSMYSNVKINPMLKAVLKSVLVYLADIWTAGALLFIGKWTIRPTIPIDVSKWIFLGSIMLSFLLLYLEIRKSRAIVASNDISYAFTSTISYRYYTLTSFAHWCFFQTINDSQQLQDKFAFFVFFRFKGWKRLLFADGPRQVINAVTLFSVLRMNDFSFNINRYGNITTIFALAVMAFTVLMFFISMLLLGVAFFVYIPILCKIRGNLKEYCCHLIDKSLPPYIENVHQQQQRNSLYTVNVPPPPLLLSPVSPPVLHNNSNNGQDLPSRYNPQDKRGYKGYNNYTLQGAPHIGHLYTATIADSFKRYYELKGKKISIESRQPVEWTTEQNYKFSMEKLQNDLLEWLEKNPEVIVPHSRYNEVKALIEMGLNDLSVSRPKSRSNWGINVPDDEDQVIYVWLDALTNYLTVTNYPWLSNQDNNEWPADIHVVGKDILRFHAIYWPSFLLAANLPLPKKILAHSHWTMEKQKMSKSRGNVVDPFDLINKYGVDAIRYYLLKDGGIVDDGDFSIDNLETKYKKDLAGQLEDGTLNELDNALIDKLKNLK
ncbi:1857_t:CDS:10, partial [Entrophospora sp. SA101]